MENIALQQLVDEVRDLPLTVSDVLAQVITECDNADALALGAETTPGCGQCVARCRHRQLRHNGDSPRACSACLPWT